ncbi:SDR family oxidoreductase [Hymenobacter sp. BT770]|uniref:SDR family NAD(P)-dependent oxidoreductase n=1 Tax=Hymenobacter sp. BT770 TaxID=2886942 RepID=UPI001D124AA8|nr:SDR family oxidoreductase [Hymenobacter sp. BT770]MCC3155116.1 SDR family oxidoreductase [Hymenobacter sp. BT770]MDO3417059.1 SDR family oxidoreductase [Hymenobacter sp. BT770]
MANHPRAALITGATSGIGRELANCFAQDHYNLVIVARNQRELEQTASELRHQYGVQVLPIAKDLFRPDAPFEIYDELRDRGIRIDALVNNAGQGQYGQFTTTDINRELDIIQLNIGAYVTFTKLFLQDMVARNDGMILQVSSIGGELPGPLQAVYHGTKAFVTSFTEAIREEVKDHNIKITALLPGVTDTDFFRKADMERSKLVAEGASKADPAKVARDGYKALLAGKDKVISGFMNKVQVAVSNVVPDSMVAANLHKMGEPVNGDESAHQEYASRR